MLNKNLNDKKSPPCLSFWQFYSKLCEFVQKLSWFIVFFCTFADCLWERLLCFQVWGAKKMHCLCTAGLEVTPSCLVPTWFPRTAPLSPGPSTRADRCNTPQRSAEGRWAKTQTKPTACPSHPTALSASVTWRSTTPAPTSACCMTNPSLTFTCLSSPSPRFPPSLTCSLEETSPWTASCSLTMMLGAASHTPATCSTSAGCLRMDLSWPKTAGCQFSIIFYE